MVLSGFEEEIETELAIVRGRGILEEDPNEFKARERIDDGSRGARRVARSAKWRDRLPRGPRSLFGQFFIRDAILSFVVVQERARARPWGRQYAKFGILRPLPLCELAAYLNYKIHATSLDEHQRGRGVMEKQI